LRHVQVHPVRVLVVEDETPIRELIADALREPGYEVHTAHNGAVALQSMRDWLPDVVVLDLMMPQLDGTGFTELARLNERFARVPVLLVTAAYDAASAARQIGARAWLSKPFELDHLVALVAELAGQPLPHMEAQPPALQGDMRGSEAF
jgi:DNA-binding response OmpR family regulator